MRPRCFRHVCRMKKYNIFTHIHFEESVKFNRPHTVPIELSGVDRARTHIPRIEYTFVRDSHQEYVSSTITDYEYNSILGERVGSMRGRIIRSKIAHTYRVRRPFHVIDVRGNARYAAPFAAAPDYKRKTARNSVPGARHSAPSTFSIWSD